MRCHICDEILDPTEIKFDPLYGEYDPCNKCKTEIEEVFEDPLDEEEVQRIVEIELLEEEETEDVN